MAHPTDYDHAHPVLAKLRELTAGLPEGHEVEAWGHPTFRVRNKIFASFGSRDGRVTVGVKQTLDGQAALTATAPFFVPKYVGKHGWVGIFVDEVSWGVVADLVERSYCMIAPKKLVKQLDGVFS